MKRLLTTLSLLIICAGTLFAQDRQHSIEITTGYPSFVFQFEFLMPHKVSDELSSKGLCHKEYFQPGINVGYTYSWKKRWEVNAMVNMHLTVVDLIQYPLLPNSESIEGIYDWNADPISTTRQTNLYGAFCASVRYKWLVRDNFSMYSALGAGISFGFPIPVPYVAPIGIKFGKGKVYGIVEANVSAATTFGMAGIGIKL